MMAGLGYLVWKGYRWAKVLVLVGLIYGTVTAIYYAFQGQATIPFKSAAGVHTLIQWILALLATTLLALSFMPAKSETGTELS